MDFRKPRFIEHLQHRHHLWRYDREMAERSAPTTPEQRTKIAQKLLRFVEDNVDTLKPSQSDETVEADHKSLSQQGRQRRQSAFAAIAFAHGEAGFTPEQISPVLHSLIEEGFITREDFRKLELSDEGRFLMGYLHGDFDERLPWREEGWEG